MTTLPNPIGRQAFLGRLFAGLVAIVGLYVGFTWSLWFALSRGAEDKVVGLLFFCLWLVAFLILAMFIVRFVIVARLASIGASRWLALLILIPYISILFLLFLLFYPAKIEFKHDAVA